MLTLLINFLHKLKRRLVPRVDFYGLPVLRPLRFWAMRANAARGEVTTSEGFRMAVDQNDSLGIAWYKTFEPFETQVIKRMTEPGMVAADIGANIGYYSLILSRAVGPTGRVHSFEPDPDNFSLLARNLKNNDISNVVTNQLAISEIEGKLDLFLNSENRGDHRLFLNDATREKISIESVTLDHYLSSVSSRLDLIKMDIQGAEYSALLGMVATVETNQRLSIVMEFEPGRLREAGFVPKLVLDFLEARKFLFFEISEAEKRVFLTTKDSLLDFYDHGVDRTTNLICSRNPSDVKTRLGDLINAEGQK